MSPICYSWYLFSRSGGLLEGARGLARPFLERVGAHPKITNFPDPSKSGSEGICTDSSRICTPFGQLFAVIWRLFFYKKNIYMAKVCLDCTGVYGLHIALCAIIYLLVIFGYFVYFCWTSFTVSKCVPKYAQKSSKNNSK